MSTEQKPRRSIVSGMAVWTVVAGCLSASTEAAQTQERSFEQIKNAVVMVDVWMADSDQSEASDIGGAGVIVGWDHDEFVVATAAHVVTADRVGTIRVQFAWDETPRRAELRWSSPRNELDLAFLEVSKTPSEDQRVPVRILGSTSADLFPADEVRTVGYPGFRPWFQDSTRTEFFENHVGEGPSSRLSLSSPIVESGSSGGPVFDADWQLLGIVLSEEARATALPIESIVNALREQGIELQLQHAPIVPSEEREKRAFAIFRYSLSQMRLNRVCIAHQGFARATELWPDSGGMVRLGGTRYTPYLPYFHRGRAAGALGRCFEARRDWRIALDQGVISDTKHLRRLETMDSMCRRRLSDQGGPEPTRVAITDGSCKAPLASESECRRCFGYTRPPEAEVERPAAQ